MQHQGKHSKTVCSAPQCAFMWRLHFSEQKPITTVHTNTDRFQWDGSCLLRSTDWNFKIKEHLSLQSVSEAQTDCMFDFVILPRKLRNESTFISKITSDRTSNDWSGLDHDENKVDAIPIYEKASRHKRGWYGGMANRANGRTVHNRIKTRRVSGCTCGKHEIFSPLFAQTFSFFFVLFWGIVSISIRCIKHTRSATWFYRGADKSLDRPTSRCILFDG
jgi:hypothetical protein